KVLYILAAPSTPDEVRVEFTELAAIGQRVTHKDVRERLDQVKRSVSANEVKERARAEVLDWQAPNLATIDRDTGEILDDEPEIEAEPVDPADPATFQWQPPPTPASEPSPNGTATAAVSRAESIASRLVKELGRSLALEVADQIYE